MRPTAPGSALAPALGVSDGLFVLGLENDDVFELQGEICLCGIPLDIMVIHLGVRVGSRVFAVAGPVAVDVVVAAQHRRRPITDDNCSTASNSISMLGRFNANYF